MGHTSKLSLLPSNIYVAMTVILGPPVSLLPPEMNARGGRTAEWRTPLIIVFGNGEYHKLVRNPHKPNTDQQELTGMRNSHQLMLRAEQLLYTNSYTDNNINGLLIKWVWLGGGVSGRHVQHVQHAEGGAAHGTGSGGSHPRARPVTVLPGGEPLAHAGEAPQGTTEARPTQALLQGGREGGRELVSE